MATQKMIAVTPSKQWIHFFLSDRWPPTSNILRRDSPCKHAVVFLFYEGADGTERRNNNTSSLWQTSQAASRSTLWKRVCALSLSLQWIHFCLFLSFGAGRALQRPCHFPGICWHFSSVQLLWKQTALRQVEALSAPVQTCSLSSPRDSNCPALRIYVCNLILCNSSTNSNVKLSLYLSMFATKKLNNAAIKEAALRQVEAGFSLKSYMTYLWRRRVQ